MLIQLLPSYMPPETFELVDSPDVLLEMLESKQIDFGAPFVHRVEVLAVATPDADKAAALRTLAGAVAFASLDDPTYATYLLAGVSTCAAGYWRAEIALARGEEPAQLDLQLETCHEKTEKKIASRIRQIQSMSK